MACNIFLDLPGELKMPALGYGTWMIRRWLLARQYYCSLMRAQRSKIHINTISSQVVHIPRCTMACKIFLTLPGGLEMPALGYGTWQSSGDEVEKGLETALAAGYRHIDTAAAYQNEDIIGKVLKRWFDSGKLKRQDVFITTKLAATCLFPDKVEQFLKESLQKLQLDYVDLYLIHFPVCIIVEDDGTAYGDPNTDHLELWKAMEAQVDAGRTKTIGVSNFTISQIDRILKNCRIKPANNQVELHVYMQQKELVDFCKENGVTVVAYSPLGAPGYNDFLKIRNMPSRSIPNLLSNLVVQSIAKKHSKTSAQVLLRYLLQLGIAAIPKSVTPARIKENIQIFDFQLDDSDMKELRDLEIGPSMRVIDWGVFKNSRLPEHPEYPF